MSVEMYDQISQALYQEAYLLDHRKYEEWLDCLTDDLIYRMPMRMTTEGRDVSNLLDEMTYYEETKKSLTTRVRRLYTTSAWVENPAPRQRHFVSNIMINSGIHPDEYNVRSYFLFKRSRGSDLQTEEIFGEREDVFRKVNGQWKIAARSMYPDQAVLVVMNLSMFL